MTRWIGKYARSLLYFMDGVDIGGDTLIPCTALLSFFQWVDIFGSSIFLFFSSSVNESFLVGYPVHGLIRDD